MNILIVVTRFPAPNTKGDQQRTWSWARELCLSHDVTVATPARPDERAWIEELLRYARVVDLPGGRVRRAASTLRCAAGGGPLQVGWMMPGAAWQRVVDEARAADVVLAMTVRAVRGPLDTPLVVDHVDALSLNMARRARGPESWPVRAVAQLEAGRLRRWEARVAGWSAAALVTAAEDAAALPAAPPAAVVPVGLDIEPFAEPPGHVRDIDVVFTGNMRYPPNRAAAVTFAQEIVPRLERSRKVRALVVGRGAASLGLKGVEVASDVPEVAAYLRRSRVAVVPLTGGTGTPYKVLEAAAAGAALVTTPWAAARFGMEAETAEDPTGFADAVARLLADEGLRRARVEAALPALHAHAIGPVAARVEALLVAASC